MGWRDQREHRRYRRAARRAFARVTFYREQCATAGRLLDEPEPTPVAALPQPPHTLCPFARPWRPEREPSLWTPSLHPLARALRLAGCRGPQPVLEIRDALQDRARLPRPAPLRRRSGYRVLLSPAAIVASPQRRDELNREAFAALEAAGGGWVVGSPEELASVPDAAGGLVRPVYRLPVAELSRSQDLAGPLLLHEPMLGYLGARPAGCDHFHLDRPRVYARERDGALSLSFPRSRRPVLLDLVPAGAHTVVLGHCPRGGAVTLVPRPAG